MAWTVLQRRAAAGLAAGCLTAATTVGFPMAASADEAGQPLRVTLGRAAAPGDLAVLVTLTRTPEQQTALTALARTAAPAAGRSAALLALQPAPATQQAVVLFAAAHGLTVAHTTSATVLLTGPAALLAPAFGATLATTAAGLRYAADELQVPEALRTAVSAAIGLDERPAMRPHAVPGGYTGPGLRAAYGGPAPAATGAGVTVALLQFGGWSPSDLATYASAAGISVGKNQITEVSIAGADPRAIDNGGSDFEVAMDAEAVLATAPAANQRLYFAPNNSAYVDDAINQMADDAAAGLVQVTSTSWGACEPNSSASSRRAYGDGIDRLVAAGATLFAASGDAGAFDCSSAASPDSRLAVDFPASYPTTVAVGGTRLATTANGSVETAWGPAGPPPSDGSYAGDGSGGGLSRTEPRPAYQQALGMAGSTRLLPDVSSVADPTTGLGVYAAAHGGWALGGGTSLAAPTWAGFTAAVLSSVGRTSGLGNILPTLYANPGAFRDVVSGQNGQYQAGPGFDLVTGLGTPRWDQLGSLLVGPPGRQGAASSPSPSPSPVPAPSPTPSPAPSPTPVRAAVVVPVTISSEPTVQPLYGSSWTITGGAAAQRKVTLHLHRAGTAPGDYSQLRTTTADANGRWALSMVANVAYRYYATAPGSGDPGAEQTSSTVLEQPAPTLTGPASRVVGRNQSSSLSGFGVPGSAVVVHVHKAGTPASDYSLLRTLVVDSTGRWSWKFLADNDFRAYVSLSTDNTVRSSSPVLVRIR